MITNFFIFLVNNYLHGTSNYFPLERGVWQGDPLSRSLPFCSSRGYSSSCDLLKSRNKRNSIENKETKILQYADHTTALLSDISSAEQLFELLNFFKGISGPKINSKEQRVCGRVDQRE